MHKLMIFIFTMIFLAGITVDASDRRNRNPDENERREQFEEIVELIEEGDFFFRARRALPMGAQPVDLTTRQSTIEFTNGIADARLPFFGRAHAVPYGQRGGIRFHGQMENVSVAKNTDRMRIRYSFEVREYDTYRVTMDIAYNGSASVNVISNQRSQMSYQGDILPAR